MVGYGRIYLHGKLVAWSQRRCVKCQRFLAKFQKLYCSKCADKIEKERSIKRCSEWRDKNHEYHRTQESLRYLVLNHADELEVGQIL
jgi:hypothetical protein